VGLREFVASAEPSSPSASPASIKISIVQCEKCAAEFPSIESRKKYLLAPAQELEKVKRSVEALKAENQAMDVRMKEIAVREEELRVTIDKVRSEGEVKILEHKQEVLLDNVAYLRKEKMRLESLYETLSLAAPLVVSAERTRTKN